MVFGLKLIMKAINAIGGKGRSRKKRRRKRLCGRGFYNNDLSHQLYTKFRNKGTGRKVQMNYRSIGGRGKRGKRMR